ncbi:MAG: hypothetical protein GY841_04370 [FCB group bacterium]|nr:hypothetical protein [FCB group bacterium]
MADSVAKQRDAKGRYLKGSGVWKPGESGNPAGPPKARVQLLRYICEYMEMTPKQLKALDTSKLTMARITALKHVQKMGQGEYNRLRDMIDRFEGKVPDHIVQQTAEITNAEAMAILREAIDKNKEDD